MASRTYTPEQVALWEDYVSLPRRFQLHTSPKLNLEYLTVLHTHQIARIPYENLLLHYSATYRVSLNPQDLFQKIVGDARGRGGYCMEGSIFFNSILRSLGFRVEMRGVRIRPRAGGVPGGKFTGWVHIVNIVTLPDGLKYSLDVAFGGDGQVLPLPLTPSPKEAPIFTNIGSQQIRLIHAPVSPEDRESPAATQVLSSQYTTSVDPEPQKFWIYQYRNSLEKPWNTFYEFGELEFFPPDFEVINHYTSTYPTLPNFQTSTILIVKFVLEEVASLEVGEGDSKIRKVVGKVMLVNGAVKRNNGGKTETILSCKTEEERVRAIKEHFGIDLVEDEVNGIKGRAAELAT